MKIVLLGASGQLGNVIYNNLKNNSAFKVLGSSRKGEKDYLKFNPFLDSWKVLGNVDVLINCIGQIEATKSFSFDKIHLGLTKLIIQNLELIGSPRVIQLSALGADKTHKVEFLRTKGIADDYLLQHKNSIIVRPSIVCTHRTMLVKKALLLLKITNYTGGLIAIPIGFIDHKIQPVMPHDLAAIIMALCKVKVIPKVINVPGPEQMSYRTLIERAFTLNKKKVKWLALPKKLVDILVNVCINPFFSFIINSQQYQLLFEDNIADSGEAEKFLGMPLTSTFSFWKNEFTDHANY